MDEIGGAAVAKRRRSAASRRPRIDSQSLLEGLEPSSDDAVKIRHPSSDGSSSLEAQPRRKEVDLNSLVPKISIKRGKKEESFEKDCANLGVNLTENRVRKVKLKVGGVVRTIHAQSSQEKEKVDPWKNLGDRQFFGPSKESNNNPQTSVGSEPVRKSKRVPKRRVLDGAFDGDDGDEEIRYLERLKATKLTMEQLEMSSSENKKRLKVSTSSRRSSYEVDNDFSLQQRSREGRKRSRSDRDSEERDDLGEEEDAYNAPNSPTTGPMEESLDCLPESRREGSLTTRQRALQTGRDGTGGNGNSMIEFPNGLPPAPPRRQKGKLSEVEQQLKKAEAAQRRRLQVEKAARESEAEAIRKILGQDSNRKKREEKLQKKREEMAQEKAAKSIALAANMVRWVLGPEGTVVTFPDAVGLPNIFDSGHSSYPAPRERCAGPSCTKPFKYRHSKLNLPLCSLQCYKAVEQSVQQ